MFEYIRTLHSVPSLRHGLSQPREVWFTDLKCRFMYLCILHNTFVHVLETVYIMYRCPVCVHVQCIYIMLFPYVLLVS